MITVLLILGIILFIVSLVLSFLDPSASSTILNFVATVIVSWIISNMSNEQAFKKKQEELAKVSHRHLGDVEKSALSIEQSIKYFLADNEKKRKNVDEALQFLQTLDSRMDDLRNRIISTNEDWYDLLSDECKKEIDAKADPESQPQNATYTQPDISPIADALKQFADAINQ